MSLSMKWLVLFTLFISFSHGDWSMWEDSWVNDWKGSAAGGYFPTTVSGGADGSTTALRFSWGTDQGSWWFATWGGSATSTNGLNTLRFWVRGDTANTALNGLTVGLSNSGGSLGSVDVANFVAGGTIGTGWKVATIPLSRFTSSSTVTSFAINTRGSQPPTFYFDNIELAFVPTTTGVPTTGVPTTGVPTTAVATTRAATTGVQTTGVATTGVPTTGVPTTGVATTRAATTAVQTTGVQTTGIATTGAASTRVSSAPTSTPTSRTQSSIGAPSSVGVQSSAGGQPSVGGQSSVGPDSNSDGQSETPVETAPENLNAGSGNNTGAIAGAAGGISVALVCCLGAAFAFIVFRRRKKHTQLAETTPPAIPMVIYADSPYHAVPVKPTYDMVPGPYGDYFAHLQIPYQEFQNMSPIGRGEFGEVFYALWKGNGVAVKQFSSSHFTAGAVTSFRKEAELMKGLPPHPNVLVFYGVCVDPQYPLCIVTEFMPNGNLLQLITSPLENKLIIHIIQGIATGMAHLADHKIVHRDLAARNVLLNANYDAKISDFGLSRMLNVKDSSSYTKSNLGPIRWMSPEAITKLAYSEKSDVWAFAVTLYEILTARTPYEEFELPQVAAMVTTGQLQLPIPQNLPVLSELMQDCMQTNPASRPNFKTIVERLKGIKAK